jgi:hypothetical protein
VTERPLATKYTHLELNRDINAPAGYYTPQKEVRLKDNGREVLYILSQAVVESSCRGTADYTSALVPGYIVGWHAGTDDDGNPVSVVEPITDAKARDRIRKIIRETEHVQQTEFW